MPSGTAGRHQPTEAPPCEPDGNPRPRPDGRGSPHWHQATQVAPQGLAAGVHRRGRLRAGRRPAGGEAPLRPAPTGAISNRQPLKLMPVGRGEPRPYPFGPASGRPSDPSAAGLMGVSAKANTWRETNRAE